MKDKIITIFWGVVLIAFAGVLLADALHIIELDLLSDSLWVVVMGVASAFFFITYLVNGLKKWGWLFPAFILAALAITAQMAINGADGAFLGAPILAAIALPFFVGWLLDRKNWGLLFPAFILTASALVTLFADSKGGAWISGLVPMAVGLPFFVAYLMDRRRRWALIPGFILLFSGLLASMGNLFSGEWVGAVTMYAIALAFLAVYLLNTRRRWALIPAIILAVIGTIPLVSAVTTGDVTAVIIMFLFATPFLIVYFWSRHNWWALIPAGIFATIGVVVLATMLFGGKGGALEGLFTALTFLGFAATFGILWLGRKRQPTGWAKWPAMFLLGAAVLAVFLGGRFQDFWPAILLFAIGITLLVGALGRKKAPEKVEAPVPPEPVAEPVVEPVVEPVEEKAADDTK